MEHRKSTRVTEFAVGILAGVSTYESVLAQALELTEDERELLVISVRRSLPQAPKDGYDAFWDGEIKRRLEALVNGEEDEMEWDEFEEELLSGG